MLIGYARVSTSDQNLTLQIDALKAAGCEKIYQDEISGTVTNRPGLAMALELLRPADTLVVWKLDRLGRTVKSLVDLVNKLSLNGIHFKSITDVIDTATPAGRFFFHIMASLAQMERELIIERTRAGLKSAASQGRFAGRKRKLTPNKVEAAKRLLESGTSPRDVAHNLGISKSTLYKWLPRSAV